MEPRWNSHGGGNIVKTKVGIAGVLTGGQAGTIAATGG